MVIESPKILSFFLKEKQQKLIYPYVNYNCRQVLYVLKTLFATCSNNFTNIESNLYQKILKLK